MLRDGALELFVHLKLRVGVMFRFALDPHSFNIILLRSTPRVSVLLHWLPKPAAIRLLWFPAKIAVGMHLDEIRLANTPASFEPTLDYVVTKMPRFPFDKFTSAQNKLGTQMKATGEVMSIKPTIEESLLKAVRSLEIGVDHLYMEKIHRYFQCQS